MTIRLALLAVGFVACGGMIVAPPIVDDDAGTDAGDEYREIDSGIEKSIPDADGPEITWGCGYQCPPPPPGPSRGPSQR